MYYFTVLIFLIIVVLLYLGLRFFSRDWMPSKRHLRISAVIAVVAALAIWFVRIPLNANLYKKIQTTDEIVVLHSTDNYDNVFFELQTDHELKPEHMGAAPVFIKAADSKYICNLIMGSTTTRHIEEMRLFEVTNTERYPEYAYFEYNGKYYAFLTGKTLYNNASYVFNKEFGEQVLQAIAPYCIDN